MKKQFLRMAIVILAILSEGCEWGGSEPSWKDHSFYTQDMTHTAIRAALPSSLWDKIKDVLSQQGSPEQTYGRAYLTLPSVFVPIRVYLIERNPGILKNGHTEIVFPAGGGELDLRDFVQQKSGSFYVAVEFKLSKPEIDPQVFYLSDAKIRKIAGDRVGAGCDKYFDVSKAFAAAKKGEGFLVNTSDARHISALAGRYFFAANYDGKLFLASLTIFDSSRKELQCDRSKIALAREQVSGDSPSPDKAPESQPEHQSESKKAAEGAPGQKKSAESDEPSVNSHSPKGPSH